MNEDEKQMNGERKERPEGKHEREVDETRWEERERLEANEDEKQTGVEREERVKRVE